MFENWWILLIGFLFGVLCLVPAFGQGRRRRLVDGLPTSKTTGIFIGLVELKGTAECDTPFCAFLSEKPCVHYAWKVEEKWEKTTTEITTDSNGKSVTKTKVESGWKEISSGGERTPFFLRDDCGSVLVRPDGAEIQPATLFSQTCRPSDALYFGKCPHPEIANSEQLRRFEESGIVVDAEIYLVGQAREREDIVAAEIAQDPAAPLFLISTRQEEKVSSSMKWWGRGWVFLGLILLFIGFLIWHGLQKNELSFAMSLYGGAAVIYLGVWFLSWIWMSFNAFVDLRQRVRQGRAQIDIQLKRRHDLIPNLLATVKSFTGFEQVVQASIAHLRMQVEALPAVITDGDYQAVASTCRILVERYPALQANELFLNLQQELTDTEDRIALARAYYNDIATQFNIRLQTFPEGFVARLGQMTPAPLES